MRIRVVASVFVIQVLLCAGMSALDLSDPYTYLSGIFEPLISGTEGQTAFRSLLIPGGGRAEAMGSAFSALANDISFLETNPAGSASMKNTELSVFHNSWIADSKLETISYTRRDDNFGYGASLRSFYVPFTEYNTFGERVSRGYYTETFGTLNIAYNFLAGYYFKGVAVGANLKAGYRSVPDYSDNNGNLVQGSGLSQSSFTVMADAGVQSRFNFLKLYNSRDPNFFVGMTARNFGPPVQGEALPSLVTFGLAYKPLNPVTLAAEIQQPVNLLSLADSEALIPGAGLSVEFARFFTFFAGFQLKGANPRASIGGELNMNDIQLNVNYTLDMTTQAALFNRVSLAAKLNLGDRGREAQQRRVEKLYIEGLTLYSYGKLEEAIDVWRNALELDQSFDPARDNIKTAAVTLELQKRIKDIQQLE